jgi:hypothetical protein
MVRTRIIEQHRVASSMYRDRHLAYFYCTKVSGDQTPKIILKSLLRQLVYNPVDRTIVQKARDMYNEPERSSFESMKQCEELFVNILEAGINVRIMIDALDECDEWRELLNVLRKIHNQASTPNQFQLLVSGRAEVDVEAKFNKAIKIDVVAARTRTEIRNYITRSIETCPKDERPVEGACPELEQRLNDILCKKANGMFVYCLHDETCTDCHRFQWIKLQLTFFLKATGKYQIVLSSDFKKELDNLEKSPLAKASELSGIYDKILERNCAEDSDGRIVMTFIFQWIICGERGLRMWFLMEALTALEPILFKNSENTQKAKITSKQIWRLVQNLVNYHYDFRFAHASIPEYLQEKNPSDYSKMACHARMAKICMEFLMDPYRGNVSPITEHSSNPEYWRKRSFRHHPQTIWVGYAHTELTHHCNLLSEEERESYGIKSLLVRWIVEEDCPAPLASWIDAGDSIMLRGVGHGLLYALERNLVDIAEALISSPKHREHCLSINTIKECLHKINFRKGHGYRVVKWLVEKVVDVHSDYNGLISRALEDVFQSGHAQAIRHFLKAHSDPNRNKHVQRALRRSLRFYGHAELVGFHAIRLAKIVIELYSDNEPLTLLSFYSAAIIDDEQTVRRLVAIGVDFTRDEPGLENPLVILVRLGNLDMARLLLETSAKQDRTFGLEVMHECLKTVSRARWSIVRMYTYDVVRIHKRGITGQHKKDMQIDVSISIGKKNFDQILEEEEVEEVEEGKEEEEEFIVGMHKTGAMKELLIEHGANSDLLQDTDIHAELRAMWDEE